MSSNKTPFTLKEHNKKSILYCIMKHSPISRAEISARIHISKPTVSQLVDELIRDKWIYESGIGESAWQGGGKPIQLHFNEKAAYIIGADIGGTKVKTVISDLSGTIAASSSFKTEAYLESGLIKQIAAEIEQMTEKSGIEREKILGMGAGVPGITDAENGIVIEAPSLNWIRYPFVAEAERYFSFPVYVENDVNAAVLGEQWLGNAQDRENVMFLAVGTGIGCGIIIHNKLYRGSANAAGELGYMVTDKNDMENEFKPTFHRYGYLESMAGGEAIGRKFSSLVMKNPAYPLRHDAGSAGLTSDQAFTYAEKGDREALAVVQEAIQHLAYGIINAACLLNPEVIILGGGVLKSADFILPRLREIVDPYLPVSVELRPSQLGDNMGVLGAVSLFLGKHDGLINDPKGN